MSLWLAFGIGFVIGVVTVWVLMGIAFTAWLIHSIMDGF